jgi:hypothetical protein
VPSKTVAACAGPIAISGGVCMRAHPELASRGIGHHGDRPIVLAGQHVRQIDTAGRDVAPRPARRRRRGLRCHGNRREFCTSLTLPRNGTVASGWALNPAARPVRQRAHRQLTRDLRTPMSHGFKTGMISGGWHARFCWLGALQNGDVRLRNRNSRQSICEVSTATPLPAIAFG